MNDNKSRDIFYGVVAVATLIVALVGATLAYFSISVNSSEGAVSAQATTVSIEYNDGQDIIAQAQQLIPSTLDVVKTVYERNKENIGAEGSATSNLCIDDFDKEVCSIYRFTVRSDVDRKITAILNNEYNGFNYLAYAVRDVNCESANTNDCWLNLDTAADSKTESLVLTQCDDTNTPITKETGEEVGECYTVAGTKKTYNITPNAINSIFGYEEKSEGTGMINMSVGATAQAYDLVLFIKENNQNQNIDQGKEYRGTLVVEVTDAGTSGQITGTIK